MLCILRIRNQRCIGRVVIPSIITTRNTRYFVVHLMSARAFIAFLRCEATQAEERATALRTVAANIENHASAEGKSILTLLPSSVHVRYSVASPLSSSFLNQQWCRERLPSASRCVIPIGPNVNIPPIRCTSRRTTSALKTAIRMFQREK